MSRDIDKIIELLKAELPGVLITQLKVAHPADDDGLWFIKLPDKSTGDVQIESSHGACPFLIESDSEKLSGNSVDEVVSIVKKLLC